MNDSQKMIQFLAFVICLFIAAFTTSANARPAVSGNTISWPDNAWYQVENRVTREIICQGGRECTVPDGVYWVSWFFPEGGGGGTRVVVGNPVENNITRADFADYLSIEGSTISWTVGGWYQIQDASTLIEICNGESACTVPFNGHYIVINHNLGLRTTVEVTGAGEKSNEIDNSNKKEEKEEENQETDNAMTESGSLPVPRRPARPVVTGNVISWPNDGFAWYQVEDRISREIVCAGGSGCTLPDGVYWVSWFYQQENGLAAGGGTRVVLGNPEENNITRENFADYLMINGKTITWSVGGWYQIQDAGTLQSICNGDESCTVPTAGQYIVINHNLGLRTTVDVH